MKLRPYQAKAIDDLWSWFAKNPDGQPIVEAAVGAGKSVLIAAIAQRAIAETASVRVLILTHQLELLVQNAEKLKAIWPEADVGVVSAALKSKAYGHQITFATVGSVRNNPDALGRIDLILVDECHLVNSKDIGTWRQLVKDLEGVNQAIRVIGFTGTPYRGNGVWLTGGKDSLFTHIAVKITMKQLLEGKFLAPLVPAKTLTKISTTDVKTSGDDFVIADLARVTDRAELVASTADEMVVLGKDRKSWLVFCVTVEHAHHVRDALRERGIVAEVVTGETPKAEREKLLEDFKAGRIRALCNVAVLTTGFDAPCTDFIANLRATMSPVLWVQINGRGMRLFDGKADTLVADFTDSALRLGPVDAIKGKAPRAPGGKNPMGGFRLCEPCGARNPISARTCIECSAKFPEPERIKHATTATGAPMLSGQEPSHFTYPVDRVTYMRHTKPGAPDMMRVQYWFGKKTVATEWICVEHSGFAQAKARAWFKQRDPAGQMPSKTWWAISAGQQGKLREPTEITVTATGEFPEIVRTVFA